MLIGASVAFASGCGGSNSQTEYVRSPSLDYGREPPRTSDGRVVGADGADPPDRLAEGVKVGSPNELAPGWTADEGGLKHDPERRAGGFGASSQQQQATERQSAKPAPTPPTPPVPPAVAPPP